MPPGYAGSEGLVIRQPLVLRLALGLGPRHGKIRVLPPFLTGMPAMEDEPCLQVMLSQHVAGDPLSLPGSGLCPGVRENLGATRTDRNGIAEPTACFVSHLARREHYLRAFGLALVGERDGHPPVMVVHCGPVQPPYWRW